jgi:hypothetical protein
MLPTRDCSVNDISRAFNAQSTGATAMREILIEEGFAALPSRIDEVRPSSVALGRCLCQHRYLFTSDPAPLHGAELGASTKRPGSGMDPSEQALRASLALKL